MTKDDVVPVDPNELRQAFLEQMAILNRFHREQAELAETHPGCWVAMGEDGVISIAQSPQEVRAEVERRGLRGKAIVRSLCPEPVVFTRD